MLIMSVNITQFTSAEVETFCMNHSERHMSNAAYHSATNGQAEKYLQILKCGLKALDSEYGTWRKVK